jgi:hypothetical protein
MLQPSRHHHPRLPRPARRAIASMVAGALLVAAPALADQLAVTVRATADEPSPGDALPATLVEPDDTAETPDPICGVCAIITRSKDDAGAATFVIPSADAFVGDIEVIVSLHDGRHVSGRITGVAVDPSDSRTLEVAAGDGWRWADVRDVWTRNHPTAGGARKHPEAIWGAPEAVAARAAADGDSAVSLTATRELAGELTLVIVSDPDRATGRPARATATLDGIQLAAGDDLAIQIATSWAFDWDGVSAAWFELRSDTPTAAGDSKPEYKYISVRRY